MPVAGMPADVRRRAKAINFGIVYGISAFGLSNQLGIEQAEAGAYIKTYFDRFPGSEPTWRRPRLLFGPTATSPPCSAARSTFRPSAAARPAERSFGERAAINAPIQGAAADIIRRAMIRMPRALQQEGLRARMILQVHDELVFEAPAEEAEAVKSVARRIMEKAAEPAVSISVPLLVEARAALNWDEAH